MRKTNSINRLAHGIRYLGVLWVVKRVNTGFRYLCSLGHHLQMLIEWGVKPNPEWFDHFIDQYYQWGKTRIPFPWERGVFNLLAMEHDARVLDICCGDGFNAYHFYSCRASKVHCIDIDPEAIAHARANFKAPNVLYDVVDIREGLPKGLFDNVLWDAEIEHFTEREIDSLMKEIRAHLVLNGVLSGYTILKEEYRQHDDHEYEFTSKEDLARFFTPHFSNVLVFQTTYPTRRNLYFFASDGTLPFDSGWADQLRISK